MKNRLCILFIIPFLVLTGCLKTPTDREWNEIKNKSDFNLFFNYAITTDNTRILQNCIDSLEKYKPQKYCEILRYYDYYISHRDTTHYSDFFVENQCDVNIDYYYRDILNIEINENDSVKTLYLGELANYTIFLRSLYDTASTDENLPRYEYLEYKGKKYMQRDVGVFIYNRMWPDTLAQKTSWHKLIHVTKDVLSTFQKVKNDKSEKIFNKDFNALTIKEKKFIKDLVPEFINIYFYLNEPPRIPPPPPPTSKEVIDLLKENENE
nr:hypothetical protein [uncultured Draconibacterium sp.]